MTTNRTDTNNSDNSSDWSFLSFRTPFLLSPFSFPPSATYHHIATYHLPPTTLQDETLSEGEGDAREKVLSQPEKVQLLAERLGREVWLPLTWKERLVYIEEAADEEMARHPSESGVGSNHENESHKASVKEDAKEDAASAPTSPLNVAGSERSASNGAEAAADATEHPPAPASHVSSQHDTTVVQRETTPTPEPVFAEPALPPPPPTPPAPVEQREVREAQSTPPAVPTQPPSSTPKKRHSMRAKSQSQRAKAKALLTRKTLELSRLNEELDEKLQKETKRGVLKTLQRRCPQVEYMRVVDAHCTHRKKRRKRVVIIEPHQMVVAHPHTGQHLRQIALEKLSGIDYQDKEYGRSVVMRFDGEADAAFVQDEKPNCVLDIEDDELLNTTVKMASTMREKKGLPPREIEPALFPMYKELLITAQTDPAHDPEENASQDLSEERGGLAEWEGQINHPSKPSNMTPNNTIRSLATLGITQTESKHVLEDPKPAEEPDQAASLSAHYPTSATQPYSPPQSAGLQRHSSHATHPTETKAVPAKPTTPSLRHSTHYHHSVPSPHSPQDSITRDMVLRAARAAHQAKGGVGPPPEILAEELLKRADTDERIRSLLRQTSPAPGASGSPGGQAQVPGVQAVTSFITSSPSGMGHSHVSASPQGAAAVARPLPAHTSPPLAARQSVAQAASAVLGQSPQQSPQQSPPQQQQQQHQQQQQTQQQPEAQSPRDVGALLKSLEHGTSSMPTAEVDALRERLLAHYTSLPPAEQQVFEARIQQMRADKRLREQALSPTSRARVLTHNIGQFNFPLPQARTYDTVRSVSPHRHK